MFFRRLRQFVSVAVLGATLALAAPSFALAQNTVLTDATAALDQAGASTYGDATAYEARPGLMTTIGSIVRVVLGLLGLLFVLLMLYAGLLWMTSSGNSDQVEKARGIIVQAVIGLIVIMAAYVLTVFVFSAFGAATGTEFELPAGPPAGSAAAGAAGMFP